MIIYIYTHWDAPLPSTRWHLVLFKPKYTKPSLYEGFGEIDPSTCRIYGDRDLQIWTHFYLAQCASCHNNQLQISWISMARTWNSLRRDPKISEVHRFVASCLCLNKLADSWDLRWCCAVLTFTLYFYLLYIYILLCIFIYTKAII